MKGTNYQLTHQVIYQIFPRNHSKSHNLNAITQDLARIKELGADIIYLMPIHPIGQVAKKGSVGSPYAIRNYYAIEDSLGNLSDFKLLLHTAHNLGLKVMMDIVFNHSARDNEWLNIHPEYYYQDEYGNFGNKEGDWSDIYDYNFNCPKLRKELINVLLYWASLGVDGFRCDVASFIPLDFWQEARKEVEKINDNIIFFGESIHKEYLAYLRNKGFDIASDGELYQVFDILYDYDVMSELEGYLKNERDLKDYIKMLKLQEMIYPKNYLKARTYENHDVKRIFSYVKDKDKLLNWLAAISTLKGVSFFYAGIEKISDTTPNLFEFDPIDLSNLDNKWLNSLKKLMAIRKNKIFSEYLKYEIKDEKLDIIHIQYSNKKSKLISICNVSKSFGYIKVDLDDGNYQNYFDDSMVEVKNGMLALINQPLIIVVGQM